MAEAVAKAGLEGVVAADSSICYIDGDAGILSYRGYNIHTLAENATFEEIFNRIFTENQYKSNYYFIIYSSY